jgi:hypothetical protein
MNNGKNIDKINLSDLKLVIREFEEKGVLLDNIEIKCDIIINRGMYYKFFGNLMFWNGKKIKRTIFYFLSMEEFYKYNEKENFDEMYNALIKNEHVLIFKSYFNKMLEII